MKYKQEQVRWARKIEKLEQKEKSFSSVDTHKNFENLTEEEIEDAFYKYLDFGTGGLRGVIGVGTNRMNRYTVAKATSGLAQYLLKIYGEKAKASGVAIAYDSRNFSLEFAKITAFCLNKFGINTYLFERITPTPMLSFAVCHLSCVAGVVITASHNPKEYNGYKVYNDEGCQITEKAAKRISEFIEKSDEFIDLSLQNPENELFNKVSEDTNQAFYKAVISHSLFDDLTAKKQLVAVYTPLHGSGNIPVSTVLKNAGFNIELVLEQAEADGDFSTVKSPNPEERKTLLMAIEKAQSINADIAFGTDPDCDRIGAGVKHQNDYKLLTGNQIGALLVDYIISKKLKSNQNLSQWAVIKTIVTNELGANIAKMHGIKVIETLTGFKYIGEQISIFNKTGENKFLFGYEESYGFLIGKYAKDKDAVGAAMLICEMAAEYKKNGKTLIDRLNELYQKHGYYLDCLESTTLEGQAGVKKISDMMLKFRQNYSEIFDDIDVFQDFSDGIMGLPRSNVLKIYFKCGSWIAVRPSGTEPKIKVYYSIKADDETSAQNRLQQIKNWVKQVVD